MEAFGSLAQVEGKITNGNEPAGCLLFVFYPYAIVRPKSLNRRKSAAFAVAMGTSATSAVAISQCMAISAAVSISRAAKAPRPSTPQDENHRELPVEVPTAAARPGLDQVFDSSRNPVPPIPDIPLPLGLEVDYRKSSSISLTTVLDTSIIAFTFVWSPA